MKKTKKKGFTILELIAAVFIFTIISISAISMITLGIKYNSINRETYNSDLISKAFIENLQPNLSRPNSQVKSGAVVTAGLADGNYYMYLDDLSEVYNYVNDNFSKSYNLKTTALDPKTKLSDIMTQVKNDPDKKKYTLVTQVKAKDGGKIYDVDIWCWETGRGEISVINRKKVINAKV
ncbi:prepilin-type N-terminal cleavage/methylation domain-containing protein [Clostridium sp. LP20]|uniref:prepilin-type N-terminal cleavage/methylation domain-containing protein n=1 Tax=Clostridium sp. LP20 TaxID=3418665 RepID=UPI003EE7CA39